MARHATDAHGDRYHRAPPVYVRWVRGRTAVGWVYDRVSDRSTLLNAHPALSIDEWTAWESHDLIAASPYAAHI